MSKNPLNDGRVIDRGHQLHSPGAARTRQDLRSKARRSSRFPGFARPVDYDRSW